jgi:hypothetical protein
MRHAVKPMIDLPELQSQGSSVKMKSIAIFEFFGLLERLEAFRGVRLETF